MSIINPEHQQVWLGYFILHIGMHTYAPTPAHNYLKKENKAKVFIRLLYVTLNLISCTKLNF